MFPVVSTTTSAGPGTGLRRRPRRNPDGNERLTAWAGAFLFVLLAIEGLTIVSVQSLLIPHVVVGVLIGALGLFVLLNEQGSRVGRLFLALSFCVGLYLFASGVSYASRGQAMSMRWIRAGSQVEAKPIAWGKTVARPLRATPCSPSFQ